MRKLMLSAMLMVPFAVSAQQPTLESIAEKLGASHGWSIANNPKIKPDEKNYYLHGKIQDPIDGEPAFLAIQSGSEVNEPLLIAAERSGMAKSSRGVFYVVLPERLADYYYSNASLNQGFDLVGVYADNLPYSSMGGEKTAPLLYASYFRLWGVDSPHQIDTEESETIDCSDVAGEPMYVLVNCATTELETQDKRLSDEYQRVMSDNKNNKDQIRLAQRQWVKDRDAACNITNEDEPGGPIADSFKRLDCLASLTKTRADQLSKM